MHVRECDQRKRNIPVETFRDTKTNYAKTTHSKFLDHISNFHDHTKIGTDDFFQVNTMKSSHAVVKVALCAILFDVALTRMVSETEKRGKEQKERKEEDDRGWLKEHFRKMCGAHHVQFGRQYAVIWVGDGDYTSEVEEADKSFLRFNGPHFSFSIFPQRGEKT